MKIGVKKIIILSAIFTLIFGSLFVLPHQTTAQECELPLVPYNCGGDAGWVCVSNPNDESEIVPACREAGNDEGGVGAGESKGLLDFSFWDSIAEGLALGALQLSGTILWLGGAAFNGAVHLSVVNMAEMFDKITAIEEVWRVIRDVANMTFIFILLYIAISTILGSGDKMKKLLLNTIIVALLINFSLFFTKVVIDASNIIALQFYKPFITTEESAADENLVLPGWDRGISNVFMEATKISTIFNPQAPPSERFSGGEQASPLEEAMKDKTKLLVVGIGGSIFLLVLAFVFLSAALLFLIRFILLMILMMLSPIAFVGMILPKLGAHSQKWLKTLIDQAFFAPVFMILIYMVARVVQSPGFQGWRDAGDGTFASLWAGGAQGDLLLAVNFMIVIGLAIAALVISKTFMGTAAKGAVDWSTKAAGRATFGTAGWAGRRSFGWAGNRLAESDRLKESAASGSLLARGLIRSGDYARKGSYDLRGTPLGGPLSAGKAYKGGYKKMQEKREKREKEYQERGAEAEANREVKDIAERLIREEGVSQADAEFRARGIREAIGLYRDKGGNLRIRNPYSSKAGPGYNVPKEIKEQAEQLEKDYANGEKSIHELREGVFRLLESYEISKGRSTPFEKDLEDEFSNRANEIEEELRKRRGKDSSEKRLQKARKAFEEEQTEATITELEEARREMRARNIAFVKAKKEADRRYSEIYAAASFGGLPDEAKRSIARRIRTGQSPEKDLVDGIKKLFEEGKLNPDNFKQADEHPGETNADKPK